MTIADLPALNAALNFISTVFISSGWYFIRRGASRLGGDLLIFAGAGVTPILVYSLQKYLGLGDIAAFEAISSDPGRHRRAARAIAEEYFKAETVLDKVIRDLGI